MPHLMTVKSVTETISTRMTVVCVSVEMQPWMIAVFVGETTLRRDVTVSATVEKEMIVVGDVGGEAPESAAVT